MVMSLDKRAKRRRLTCNPTGMETLPEFLTFPPPPVDHQPFRYSVKRFLLNHARLLGPHAPSILPSFVVWRVLLHISFPQSAVVALEIVEEDISTSQRSVYCDHCRLVEGWGGHPVCKKKYHFIIRRGVETESYLNEQPEAAESEKKLWQTYSSDINVSKNYGEDSDFEDWLYLQLEDNTHLLHAVVHSNGFGHLLTLNGINGGSSFLSGRHIMDFWDRLCLSLSVREVSVMDVSKKYGVEYRLLHAVTKGHSWYGKWGYEFRNGSYAITKKAYQSAVHTLSNLPLAPFLIRGRGRSSNINTRLQSVISFYQALSETELQTLKDLFCCLLSLLGQKHTLGSGKRHESSTSKVSCAWTLKEVEHVQQQMIKVLAAADEKRSWVTRRSLKGAMYKAASLELLDYSLKHFVGKVSLSGMVVRSRCNNSSSGVEYRLEPFNVLSNGSAVSSTSPSEEQITCDLKFLYESLLHPNTMGEYGPKVVRDKVIDSATKLLDCKQFLKVYKSEKMTVESPDSIYLWCHAELLGQPKHNPTLPPELLILPLNSTVADLKCEASRAFQDVYAMFTRFQAEQLVEYGSIEDSITIQFLIGSSGSVHLQGKSSANYAPSHYCMERGTENWKVDCLCGAKDDDGERMLACDNCGVWQHTRCVGIAHSDEILAKFVCLKCSNSNSSLGHHTSQESAKDVDNIPASRTSCRGKAASNGISTNLYITFGVR